MKIKGFFQVLSLFAIFFSCTAPPPARTPADPSSSLSTCDLPSLTREIESLTPGEQRGFVYRCHRSDDPGDWKKALEAAGFQRDSLGPLIHTMYGAIFEDGVARLWNETTGELLLSFD